MNDKVDPVSIKERTPTVSTLTLVSGSIPVLAHQFAMQSLGSDRI